MKAADELDRMLNGEPVEASQPVRELAELAALLQGAWQQGPGPAAADKTRAAAMEAFAAVPTVPIAPGVAPLRPRPTRGRRVFARVALVAALVAGLPTAAWAASEDALPGEILYPLKRGFEETQLILAGDAASEAAVLLEMVHERLEEAIRGLALGLEDVVEEALLGYEDAMLRSQARIVEAEAEGLPVESLLEQAEELADAHDQLFEPEADLLPTQPEISIGPADSQGQSGKGDKGGKAGKGQGGKGGKPGNKGGKGNRANGNDGQGSGGSGGAQGGGGSTGGGGGGGGSSTGGGGGGGGGGGTREDPPPPAEDPEDDRGDEVDPSEQGLGLGHEKGKGKGHTKDKGEGHDHG